MTIEASTLKEWRAAVGARNDIPFSPPPFELFMADESEAGATVRFETDDSRDWLEADVRRREFGDSFDLEIVSVAVRGEARDRFDRRVAEDGSAAPRMVGTGLFREFMRAAERTARERHYSALICRGVVKPDLWPVLERYGYRNFESMGFRKILRSGVKGKSSAVGSTFYGRVMERFGA